MFDRRSFLRRPHPGTAVAWPVTVFSNNRTLRGAVESIGAGGAILRLAGQPGRNDLVRVVVELADRSEVVTAEGTVAGTIALAREGESPFPFAVTVEFTAISDKSRRLIAELLSPTRRPEHAGPAGPAESSRSSHPARRAAVLGILGLGAVLALSLGSLAIRGDTEERQRLERIADRLEAIESQLQSLHSAQGSVTAVAERVEAVQRDLVKIRESIPESGKIDRLVQRLEGGERGGVALYSGPGDVAGESADVALAMGAADGAEAEPAYHVVQKGENLYRISTRYHLKIDYLRQVNGLGPGSQVHPGQILLVK